MTPEVYKNLSENTERKFDGETEIGAVAFISAAEIMKAIIEFSQTLDEFKKCIVYGAEMPDTFDLGKSIPSEMYQATVTLRAIEMETMHAVMGLITEVGEVADLLLTNIAVNDGDPDKLDIANLAEELGDIKWYEAILLRLYDLDDGKIRETNIKKLQARFPEKFDSHKALNRDLETERAILEEGVR